MIKVFPSTHIYISCPPASASGGPLALHQLAFKLKALGYRVFMFYSKKIDADPVHENYKEYEIPYVFEIHDVEENILIVPEVETKLLYTYKNVRRAIWWLSIDFYYKSAFILKMFKIFGYAKPSIDTTHLFFKLEPRIFEKKRFTFSDVDNCYHLTQSQYAYNYIRGKSSAHANNIAMLSDYLLPIFFEKECNNKNKENIVLYNPVKGIVFTKKLINLGKEIKWIPIENMAPLEVKDLLNRAKIYIDFGEHPGRDRFPREAAISGCCIITGKRGSAAFKEDVPIDMEFKFDETNSNLPVIIKKITDVLKNYDKEYDKFNEYRTFIKRNEHVFEKEINEIFTRSTD